MNEFVPFRFYDVDLDVKWEFGEIDGDGCMVLGIESINYITQNIKIIILSGCGNRGS